MPGRFRQHDKSEIQSAVATHAHARAAQLVWHGLPCAEPLPVVHAKIGGVTQSGLTDPIRCPVTHDTGLDCSTQFSVLSGGNAALKPEQSEQATAGDLGSMREYSSSGGQKPMGYSSARRTAPRFDQRNSPSGQTHAAQ